MLFSRESDLNSSTWPAELMFHRDILTLEKWGGDSFMATILRDGLLYVNGFFADCIIEHVAF